MTHPRTFRFGVQLSQAASAREWAEKARKVADLGYSTVFMPDHFGDQLAPIPALMAVADASDLRIGGLVLGNDYRHPVVLAKEAATIDLLSDGRLELGLGAGWMRSDYDEAGLPYERPGMRISRLEESVTVLKGLFGEGPFSFDGTYYRITSLDGRPKPVQRPHPPFVIGGGGPRVLRLAGREADIVGVNVNLQAGAITPEMGPNATAEATDRKIAWIKEGAGARFDDLELNILVFVGMVTSNRRQEAESQGALFGLSPEEALEVPYALVGTVDEICADLEKRRERYGISYIVFHEGFCEELAPVVERLTGR